MPPTRPWQPCEPVWTFLDERYRASAQEWFEERAAIMEFEHGYCRHAAEQRAYAFIVHDLLFADVVRPTFPDAARQLHRARLIRHDNEIAWERWQIAL